MIMFNKENKGSAAPLALLFTLVSMSFTVAYLKNSFSQSAMEKYRYAEWKALYSAVLNYAYENDFNRVAWEVIDWNTNAIEFYKSTGATYLNDWSVVQMNKENLSKFIQNN